MSESNEGFEYFNLRSSDKSRGEKANFDVLDKVDFVPNALGLNVCTDLRRSESGVNNSSHFSPEEIKEDDDRTQMVNLPKLLNQLFNARVVLERLSISTRAANLRRTDSLTSDNPCKATQNKNADDCKITSNKLTTIGNRQKHADLVRRYCSKCIITVAVVNVSTTQLCAKCGTLLDFQCTRCDKLYSVYNSLLDHLNSICNRQNLDLKCSKCDYQTHVRRYMYMHKTYCLSELFHSCSQCEYRTKKRSNLYTHMRAKHKDNNMKAHGDLVAIGSTSDIADGKEKDNMLTTSGNRQKPADLVRRYCSKCIITVAVVNASTTQLCAKCGTLLDFQCIRCDKLYSVYNSLLHHLNTICNRQNLDLKCPKCDYRTHAKSLMRSHLNYCTSGIKYSCSHCKYTTKRKSDFHRHRQIHLRDNDIKAHGDLVAIGNTSEIADGKEKDSG